MSVSKFVILTIFLSLILTHVRAEASVDGKVSDSEDEAVKVVRSDTSVDSSALKVELDNLKSKIHDLGQFLCSLFPDFSTLFFLFFVINCMIVIGF